MLCCAGAARTAWLVFRSDGEGAGKRTRVAAQTLACPMQQGLALPTGNLIAELTLVA